MGARLLGFLLGAVAVFVGLIAAARASDGVWVIFAGIAAVFVALVFVAVVAHRRAAQRASRVAAGAASGVLAGTAAFFGLVVWALSQFE